MTQLSINPSSSGPYKTGDAINGVVNVIASEPLSPRQIEIALCMRTHGKGDRIVHRHTTKKVPIAHMVADEQRTIPYSFTAPPGPSSYRGHTINIEWQVEAHLDISILNRPNASALFELEGETHDFIALGLARVERTTIEPTWAPVVPLALSTLAGLAAKELTKNAYFFPLILLVGALYALWLLRQGRQKSARFKNVECKLPQGIRRGEAFYFDVAFKSSRSFVLERVRVRFKAVEVASSSSGSGSSTSYHDVYTHTVDLPGKEIASSDSYRERTNLIIPHDAPESFRLDNNRLDWIAEFDFEVKRGHSHKETFALTVL